MAIYVAVGTPGEEGRVQEFRMVPPPGGAQENQVLLWNPETQAPEWKLLSELVVVVEPPPTYFPVVDSEGAYLVDVDGRRRVARPPL